MRSLLNVWMYGILGLILLSPVEKVSADQLIWNLPGGIGTIGLPFQSTELLLGYDVVQSQGIGGVSLPVLTLGKTANGSLIDLHLGACGAYPTQAANVQPYIAFGHDIARDLPVLSQFKSLHINGFGRIATDKGPTFKDMLGAGGSVSWSFGQ